MVPSLGQLVPSFGQLMLAAVWLSAVIFLWHYARGLRKNLMELRACRREYVHPDMKRPDGPADARRAMMGEAVAFTAILLLALLALVVVAAGLVWFLARVIGGLRALA